MLLDGSAVSLRDGTSRWVERANPSLGSPQRQTDCWEVTRNANRAFWGNAILWRNSTKRGLREDRCSRFFPLGSQKDTSSEHPAFVLDFVFFGRLRCPPLRFSRFPCGRPFSPASARK